MDWARQKCTNTLKVLCQSYTTFSLLRLQDVLWLITCTFDYEVAYMVLLWVAYAWTCWVYCVTLYWVLWRRECAISISDNVYTSTDYGITCSITSVSWFSCNVCGTVQQEESLIIMQLGMGDWYFTLASESVFHFTGYAVLVHAYSKLLKRSRSLILSCRIMVP